ncbi:MAG TPA: carboxypeptidase-like regulatory domain-containing protein [Thermoanaerobaculia bacterium]|nr:carboxypeptidase-like regulatory domain-containing protein [Thermoanaerobaculia bacterium]
MPALSRVAAIPFLFLFFAASLQAASPTLSGVAASGRIVGFDGRPVTGAEVGLIRSAEQKPGPHRAKTGSDGRFTIPGLPPGVYVLRVAHPEHPRFHQPGIDVPEGMPKVDLGGFSLRKAERVEGQVVDQEGRPVAGVRILQERSGPLEIAAAPATGPEGRFVLPELIAGRLTLCKEGYDSSWGPIASRSQLSKLARIVLRPVEPPFRVTGRILDSEGRPVAGARVRSGPHESGCVVATLIDPCTGEVIPDQVVASDADGRFSLEIRERTDFDFRAEAPGYLPAVQSRVSARPGQSAEIELVLRQTAAVTGRVLAQDGSPAAGVRVTRFPDLQSPEAITDAQGRFRLEGIAPERQAFQAQHPKLGQALRRLEVAPGGSSLEFRLDGVPERAAASREIPLGPGQSLDGRLLGVEAEHLATAVVEARKGEDSRQTEVTREGRYRFRGLSPGEWTVTAHVQGGRSGATRVLLEPGQRETLLDLEVTPHLEIRGRVLEPDGTPANAQVRFSRSGEIGSVSAWSDADGRFSLKVPSGTYFILATQAKYAPARLEPVTVAEPLDGLEIRLRPGWTLAGRIPDLPAGAHASIQAQQDGAYRMTQAGPDGAYRFDNLGPGEWKLTASVSVEGFYRDGQGSAVLAQETGEARFDFDLALGSASLSGKLGPDDEPILATMDLLSSEGEKVATTSPGLLDGEFRFPHLRPGTYTLRITDRDSGRVLTRDVEVSGSEEIEIDLRK